MSEFVKPYHRLEAMDGNVVYVSVDAPTAIEAVQELEKRLTALTRVEGIQISAKAIVQGDIGWKIGIFRFPQQHLDSRPLTF